jgi:hypothetical protein
LKRKKEASKKTRFSCQAREQQQKLSIEEKTENRGKKKLLFEINAIDDDTV